jgi:kynurenine formamidase
MSSPEASTPAVSEWPADDRLGAGNHLSASTVLRAMGLVKQGRVIDLTLAAGVAAPRIPGTNSPFVISMWSHPFVSQRNYIRRGATNGVGFADERIEFDTHTGTHIDALGHTCQGETMYNGLKVADVVTNRGLNDLDSTQIPAIISRGVLIDAGPADDNPADDNPGCAGDAIDRARLEKLARAQGVQVERGDVVLIRTGWGRYYQTDNEKYVSGHPGISLDAARWLADQGAVAVGADTMSVEVVPSERPEDPYPVHQYLLVTRGVFLIEQIDLEELARLGVHEFLCCCLPPKLAGATGSPLRLVAVV